VADKAVLRPVDFDPFAAQSDTAAVLPLTEPQGEMCAAAAMAVESNCSYNQCFAFALRGPLDVESLRTALGQALERHEALRAALAADGASQSLQPPAPLPLPVKDLSALDAAARAQEIERLLHAECVTPFDLASGPLLRGFVVREGEERHRFVLTVHHIVCDGWSSSVLFSDLGRLYAADRLGVMAQLPAPASYRGYLEEQSSAAHAAAAAADEDYWAAQYQGGVPALQLPQDAPHPAVKTYAAAQEDLRIGAELYTAVKKTGGRHGATLFATLLAAFEVLVNRLTNQPDFVVGIPFAGQLQLANPHLVAHCVNTVPLHTHVAGDASFVSHLKAARHALAEAQEHASLTFGSLVRRLRLPRDRSRTPLVTITFNIDKVGAPFDFGDLVIEGLRTPKAYSNFELAVNVVDSGSDLVVECGYNSDLFTADTIKRWLGHYQTLLRSIVADPQTAVERLAILSDEEQAALGGNAAAPALAVSADLLHERFEAQARLNPARLAASCGNDLLTYGELDRKANALAARLRTLGVGPEVLVALRTDRSLNILVGILGILKAGGAYLPLDPAYPKDRIDFMLRDSAARAIVTETAFVEDFADAAAPLVVLDRDPLQPAEAAPSGATAASLAYVIYTSGSTGEPKGVEVTHANVVRLMDATHPWFGFDASDVWTLFHSYAFDFSVWEMWGALFYGGRIEVVPFWVSRSPDAFWALLLERGVTVLNQTPSAFRQLVNASAAAAAAQKPALRHVIFGGEALELESLRPWFARHGDQQPRLVNMYGITETTVHVTYRPVSGRDLDAGLGSVIGEPIPDLRIHLLDAAGERVPTGVAGEIHVGGPGVARGYLRRPELSAQRFVADRFGGCGRLYKSGDLARRLANGDLEYLGRIDAQVKIRGFRIELGEIETALLRHEAVREAVVMARDGRDGDRRLVAWIAAAQPDEPLAPALKAHLRESLPDYMVPAQFVVLASLPLTANGKVDRQALPEPDAAQPAAPGVRVAPRTETEERLCAIWGEALGMAPPGPGIEDDFFDLGGHSLMAVRIVTTIRSSFGIEIGMRHLFEQPTIAGLAAIVDMLAVARGPAATLPSGGEREKIEI
jgi:amino acid adenylation domain-containing protein